MFPKCYINCTSFSGAAGSAADSHGSKACAYLQCSSACPAGMRATQAGEMLVSPKRSTSTCQVLQDATDPTETPPSPLLFSGGLGISEPFPPVRSTHPADRGDKEPYAKYRPFPVPESASPRCKTSSMLATIILCTSCSSVLMEPRFLLARLSM